MAIYEQHKLRKTLNSGTVASSFASTSIDQKQWLFAVFNVTKFLCSNGLPFRGSHESNIETADDLFLRAFSPLLFPLEPKWRQIHKNLPNNATYTLHAIQNQVIETLVFLVKKKIAEGAHEVELFTIMADGTTDKNGVEVQGLVYRYLSADGKVKENCLNVKGIHDRSAKGVFGFAKEPLDEFKISPDGLVSQSFDGARVMSGDYGGLQRPISDFCGRYILYVHCFVHNINLIVTSVVQNIEEINEYFTVLRHSTTSSRKRLSQNTTAQH